MARTRAPGLAAIYARVSTERQAIGDKTSLDRQEKNCRRTAKNLDLAVNEGYVIKEAHSASDPDNRPGLDTLYAAIERQRGQFQYVLMDVVDRTTRAGIFDFVEICNRFLRAGVEPIWSSNPEWDLTHPHGQHEASEAAYQAYRDKETIARRFKEGKDERIANGGLIRSFMAYGYRWNAERPRFRSEYSEDDSDPRTSWVLDEGPRADGKEYNTAAVMRHIFTYLATGWRTNSDASAVKLMDQLNAAQTSTPSQVKGLRNPSLHWSVTTITSLVHNPTYKGKRPQNRWVEDTSNVQARRAMGLKARGFRERPKDEWVWVDVPPIVDEETWEDANKQLARNLTHNHRQPKRYAAGEVLLYGGIVRCAYCHYSMTPMRVHQTDTKWYYACAKGTRPLGRECPGNYPTILASAVDAYVWRSACAIIKNPAYLRSLLAQTDEAWPLDDEIAYRDREIAKLEADTQGIQAEVLHWGGDPAFDSLRQQAQEAVKKNVEAKQGHIAKRDAAVAEKERQAGREQRIAEFTARSRENAESLDTFDATQRRQILLDLHPAVFVRLRDDAPRVWASFDLSNGAASQLSPRDRSATYQQVDAKGRYWVTSVSVADEGELSHGGVGAQAKAYDLDLTDVEAATWGQDEDDVDDGLSAEVHSANAPDPSSDAEGPAKLPYKTSRPPGTPMT